MKPLTVAGLLVVLTIVATPLHAEPRNPCDHYLPTGEALPRQDTARNSLVVRDEPTWRGRRVGSTHAGDPVDVLKECGRQVEIRTPDGVTGWVSTFALPREEMLRRRAATRTPSTAEECEARYEDTPQLADSCKDTLARKQARAEELAHSVALTGDLLRGFVAGKTVTITGRPGDDGKPAREAVTHAFFDADGEVFTSYAGVSGPARFGRGRWLIDDDKLCLPNTGIVCSTARRIPSGDTILTAKNGTEFVAVAEDGDKTGLVRQVSAVYPYAEPPPVPNGLAGLAHPSMGW